MTLIQIGQTFINLDLMTRAEYFDSAFEDEGSEPPVLQLWFNTSGGERNENCLEFRGMEARNLHRGLMNIVRFYVPGNKESETISK